MSCNAEFIILHVVFCTIEELNVITGTGPYLLYAGLIVDPVIEDILVLEEQDFNPSLVVVAVSGWDPVGTVWRPSRRGTRSVTVSWL